MSKVSREMKQVETSGFVVVGVFGRVYGYSAEDGSKLVLSPQLGWVPTTATRAWLAAVKDRLSGGAL